MTTTTLCSGAWVASAPRLGRMLPAAQHHARRQRRRFHVPVALATVKEEGQQQQQQPRLQISEAEQLSVIASSIMALGVLPGEELKVMLIGVCEAMPADALKALLLAAGDALEPRQHKNLLMFAGPAWVNTVLGNHTEATWWNAVSRDTSRGAIRRLVPRRVAKTLLLRWCRETPADDLKRMSANAARRVTPARVAILAPRVLAAVVGAPVAPMPPPPKTLPSFQAVEKIGGANATTTTSEGGGGGGPRWMFWRHLQRSGNKTTAALPAPLPTLQPIESILSKRLDAGTAAWLVPRLLLAIGPSERRDAIGNGVRVLSERRAIALLETPIMAAAVSEDIEARARRDLEMVMDDTRQGATSKKERGRKAAKPPLSKDAKLARSAVTEAVERLPPALVAAQLRSLVESLPARFVRDEAVNLVEALPPNELVEAATNLIDATPETALRTLTSKLLDAVANRKGRRPNSAAALRSLARAAENCDVEILRSTARSMILGVRPEALAEEVVRLLYTEEAPYRVKRVILDALIAAENKSRRFANLKEMFSDGKKLEQDQKALVESPTQLPIDDATDRVKTAIDSLKRILLERRAEIVRDGPDEEQQRKRSASSQAPSSWPPKKQAAGENMPLEALLVSALRELSPELLIEKALETLAALPPETYESLAKLFVDALWKRVVLSAMPSGVSSCVQEAVRTLGEKPQRDATLAASYVASATGGVAGGAAAKGSLVASAKLSASAKSALALSQSVPAITQSAGVAFGAKVASFFGSFVSAKTLALASVTAYVAQLIFTGLDDNGVSFSAADAASEWAGVAQEACIAACLLAFAAIGVTFFEELAAGGDSSADLDEVVSTPIVLPPNEQIISTLLGSSDKRLRSILQSYAKDPPTREAALACRDAFKDFAINEKFDFKTDPTDYIDRAKRRAMAARADRIAGQQATAQQSSFFGGSRDRPEDDDSEQSSSNEERDESVPSPSEDDSSSDRHP